MKTPVYRILYVQVLFAIVVGIVLGQLDPGLAQKMKPLGDGFVALIRMVIAPIIFCTVVSGIAHMDDMKKVGRVGGKALVYFEVMSTLALLAGLLVAHLLHPGAGFNVDPKSLDAHAVSAYASQAHEQSTVDFLLHIIPLTVVDAFARGEVLQVLLVALLFGAALAHLGPRGAPLLGVIDQFAGVFFRMVTIITRVAPIGAFGAMAFTVGKYGLGSLLPLLKLVGTFYVTSLLFVLVVLGLVARVVGFSIVRFLVYIKEELLIVLGTSSSEAALPQLMAKLENLGCSKPVVGLVVPTGYSFNLDGTNIYMTLAVLFIAQALNVDLTTGQEATILLVAMLTSKGASGVTGSGFITLAATLSVVQGLPVEGMVLILGIDKFMSECRALTNIVGNGVACVVVSAWERELDHARLAAVLRTPAEIEAAEPVEEPAGR